MDERLRARWVMAVVFAAEIGMSAFSQAAPASGVATPGGGIEQVVVTARKRNEKLQKVPVAVTALSAAQLAQNKIVSINDLGAVTPSLTFQQGTYTTFGSLIGIRGQKTGDTILSETPSIGIYVDDVYAPSTIGTGIGNLYDTSSVEILKGPQGTLYGRNTTGGAVKIASNLPGYDGYFGNIKVGFGNYGSNEDAGMVNIPIIDQKAALRMVFERTSHDGFGTDLTHDRPVADSDARSLRATLRLDPTDDLNIIVRGNWSDGRSGGILVNLETIKPVLGVGGVPTFSPTLLNTGLEIGSLTFPELLPILDSSQYGPATAADLKAVLAGQTAAYNALLPYVRPGYDVHYSLPQWNRVKDDGLSINATYQISDDLSIKSITSYQYAFSGTNEDGDATPFVILEGLGDTTSLDQLTQEVQLSGKGLDQKLVYTAGIYYYHLTGNDDSPGEAELPYLNPTGSPVNTRDHLFDTSKSAYGQATYAFLPTVHLTAGVRWTEEDTELVAHSTEGPSNICNLPAPAGIGSTACAAEFSNAFHNFSYTYGMDWQATDAVLLYAKSSRGFKAGGQNQRGGIEGGFDSFAPELVTDYEIGEKADLLDHRVRINMAAYHSDYTNIQRSVLVVTPQQQTITEIRNAAAATINGVELELTARPVPSLILQANAAYTSAQYTSYFSAGENFSGHDFEGLPLWQTNMAATYVHEVNFAGLIGSFTGTINLSYQTHVNYAPDNTSIYDVGYPVQGGYALLNARLALDVPKYGVTLEAWGKNLTDRKYIVGATDITDALGLGNAYLSNPVTFGFDAIKRF